MSAKIEYCYLNGSLSQALEQAAEFIKRINERKVVAISSSYGEDIGWTVIVVYEE